jgi:hypothetical protein
MEMHHALIRTSGKPHNDINIAVPHTITIIEVNTIVGEPREIDSTCSLNGQYEILYAIFSFPQLHGFGLWPVPSSYLSPSFLRRPSSVPF